MSEKTVKEAQALSIANEYVAHVAKWTELNRDLRRIQNDISRVEAHRSARAKDLARMVGANVSHKCLTAKNGAVITLTFGHRNDQQKPGAVSVDTYDSDGEHVYWESVTQ